MRTVWRGRVEELGSELDCGKFEGCAKGGVDMRRDNYINLCWDTKVDQAV